LADRQGYAIVPLMKYFALFAVLFLFACSTTSKYAYRAGFEGWDADNLKHLSLAEKKFYKTNKEYLTRDEWSHWLFEETKTGRDEAWKKYELDVILAERKSNGEKPNASPTKTDEPTSESND